MIGRMIARTIRRALANPSRNSVAIVTADPAAASIENRIT